MKNVGLGVWTATFCRAHGSFYGRFDLWHITRTSSSRRGEPFFQICSGFRAKREQAWRKQASADARRSNPGGSPQRAQRAQRTRWGRIHHRLQGRAVGRRHRAVQSLTSSVNSVLSVVKSCRVGDRRWFDV